MGTRHRAGADLKSMQHELASSPPCLHCGQRLGKHRFGDDACPNTAWRVGNGQPQWDERHVYTDRPMVAWGEPT